MKSSPTPRSAANMTPSAPIGKSNLDIVQQQAGALPVSPAPLPPSIPTSRNFSKRFLDAQAQAACARAKTPERRAGDNIEQPVEVTLQEAYTGGARTYNIQATETCAFCHGTGEVADKTCANCNGQGQLARSKRIQVKIPPGVESGSRIRVAGEGQPGTGGGPRGDLYLVITVKPNPLYERKGDDLSLDFEVDLVTAILGGEAQVPLPDGRKLVLTIPQETQNGRVFRLAGKGMPHLRGEGSGNIFARVKVVLPMSLTQEERDLFEQLARIRGASLV